MKRWEYKLAGYNKWKIVPDTVRWVIILGAWGYIFYLLFSSNIWGAVIWAILWVPIGFIVMMNVVGFLTLPLYALVGFFFRVNIEKDVLDQDQSD